MKPLVLASRSAARAKMLKDAGIPIEPRSSPLDETVLKAALVSEGLGARDLAARLAMAKAQAAEAGSDELVLGADQTLEQDGRLFDKPETLDRLREQLAHLQGRSHTLHAAAALVRDRQVVWSGVSSVRLTMRPLSAVELDRYVEDEGPTVLDCVGGYRLEGVGVQLFDAMEGEYFAVLGLPLLGILQALRGSGA